VRTLRNTIAAFAICVPLAVLAQEQSTAVALDHEISKLGDIPEEQRPRAIHSLLLRIRQQPPSDAAALAYNLAASATEAGDHDALQEVAATLADEIRSEPPNDRPKFQYEMLAKLTLYYHARVSLDHPKYAAALAALEADDQRRSQADFTLADINGHQWNLRSLRGKVVLINFWATWCPPCRREMPDLGMLYERFRDRGLVILAVTDEEATKVTPFLIQEKVTFPVLLDPGRKVNDLFHVEGVPMTFVFDRRGHLVGEMPDRPTMSGFLEMLAQAGLP
jgi:peroxiredoxin